MGSRSLGRAVADAVAYGAVRRERGPPAPGSDRGGRRRRGGGLGGRCSCRTSATDGEPLSARAQRPRRPRRRAARRPRVLHATARSLPSRGGRRPGRLPGPVQARRSAGGMGGTSRPGPARLLPFSPPRHDGGASALARTRPRGMAQRGPHSAILLCPPLRRPSPRRDDGNRFFLVRPSNPVLAALFATLAEGTDLASPGNPRST